MKNILLIIVVLLVVVVGAVSWNMYKHKAPETNNVPITPNDIQNQTTTKTPGTIVISSEKPASFEGVEMVTYESPYGYEIMYPKGWLSKILKSERPSMGEFEGYGIFPTDPGTDGAMIVIGGFESDIEPIQADIEHNEKWVVINGERGVYYPGPKPGPDNSESYGDSYSFRPKDKQYNILLDIPTITRMGWNKQEALWVLSTFKITE